MKTIAILLSGSIAICSTHASSATDRPTGGRGAPAVGSPAALPSFSHVQFSARLSVRDELYFSEMQGTRLLSPGGGSLELNGVLNYRGYTYPFGSAIVNNQLSATLWSGGSARYLSRERSDALNAIALPVHAASEGDRAHSYVAIGWEKQSGYDDRKKMVLWSSPGSAQISGAVGKAVVAVPPNSAGDRRDWEVLAIGDYVSKDSFVIASYDRGLKDQRWITECRDGSATGKHEVAQAIFSKEHNRVYIVGKAGNAPFMMEIDYDNIKCTNSWIYKVPNMSAESAGFVDVVPVQDGMYLVGEFDTRKNRNVLVVKVEYSGKAKWYRLCGGRRDDVANVAIASPDGGIIFGGQTSSRGAGNLSYPWVMYLDKDGFVQADAAAGASGEVIAIYAHPSGNLSVTTKDNRHWSVSFRTSARKHTWQHAGSFYSPGFSGGDPETDDLTCFDPTRIKTSSSPTPEFTDRRH